jgi:putative oxidoreductase
MADGSRRRPSAENHKASSGGRVGSGAVLLLIFRIPTTLLFDGNGGDAAERIQLLKNLSIMAGLLFVIERDNA